VQGKRHFAPVMTERLRKLGITKSDPEELTPEERGRFARLDIDPDSITWRRVMDVNDRCDGVEEGGAALRAGGEGASRCEPGLSTGGRAADASGGVQGRVPERSRAEHGRTVTSGTGGLNRAC
jgi:hypothetical protein